MDLNAEAVAVMPVPFELLLDNTIGRAVEGADGLDRREKQKQDGRGEAEFLHLRTPRVVEQIPGACLS